jgi:hypothetical protein
MFPGNIQSPPSGFTLKIEVAYSFETLASTYNNIYLFWRSIFSMRIFFDIRGANLHIILPLILIFTCLLRPRDLDFFTGNSNVLFLSRMYWKKEVTSPCKLFSSSFGFSNNIAESSQEYYFPFSLCQRNGSPDISVSTVSRLDNWGIRVRFLENARDFSLQHSVQTSSWAHSASYTMVTGGFSPCGYAFETQSRSLTAV